MKSPAMIAALTIVALSANAETDHQQYKGLEARDISSLSAEDIKELRQGAGWGLALPAELNGYPGPAHVLELWEDLGLSDAQVTKMQTTYDEMQAQAIAAGNRLIEAERSLDQGFKAGALTPEALRLLIADAEEARADLRFVHLSRHLQSVDLLTEGQISEYARLRGYAPDDPCQYVPEGHDADLWRRHNGCEG